MQLPLLEEAVIGMFLVVQAKKLELRQDKDPSREQHLKQHHLILHGGFMQWRDA